MRTRKSFRPLAGIMVLIPVASGYKAEIGVEKFPSPCGDYGSYPYVPTIIPPKPWTSFRPLAGIMVLISCGCQINRYTKDYVSVPLRGLWFLSGCGKRGTYVN